MPGKVTRKGLVAAASCAALICGLGIGVPSASASASTAGGQSNVCSAVNLPTTTQTVGVTNVFHVTVFTCGDATATGFQQCPSQTVKIPDVVHTTVFYCVPLEMTAGANGESTTVTLNGVGGVTVGTGSG